MPKGRDETLPQGTAVFYRKMRHREAQFRSGAAWPISPSENGGLRNSIARNAKGEAHLRITRARVPQLFRKGGADQRPDRLESYGYTRTPARQRRLSNGSCGLALASAPARAAWPHSCEGSQSQHPELSGAGGRRYRAEGKDAPERDGARGAEPGEQPGRCPVARY